MIILSSINYQKVKSNDAENILVKNDFEPCINSFIDLINYDLFRVSFTIWCWHCFILF